MNDYEALALSLPHLQGDDLVQIGGQESPVPKLKIVMGPGTGLGMAALAPLPHGGWMALPGELGQVTLPTVTREEFDLRERMKKPGSMFIAEDAVSGSGLYLLYKTLSPQGKLPVPKPSFRQPCGAGCGGGKNSGPFHLVAGAHFRRCGHGIAGPRRRLSRGWHCAVNN